MSRTARRVLDFLLVDHMAHAGTENGALMATYDQMIAGGLPRRLIAGAIRELENLGLIRAERGGICGGQRNATRFRLTFYATKDGQPATNDWKGITSDRVKAAKAEARRAPRNNFKPLQSGPIKDPQSGALRRRLPAKTAENRRRDSGPKAPQSGATSIFPRRMPPLTADGIAALAGVLGPEIVTIALFDRDAACRNFAERVCRRGAEANGLIGVAA